MVQGRTPSHWKIVNHQKKVQQRVIMMNSKCRVLLVVTGVVAALIFSHHLQSRSYHPLHTVLEVAEKVNRNEDSRRKQEDTTAGTHRLDIPQTGLNHGSAIATDPQHSDPKNCPVQQLTSLDEYYQYIETPKLKCDKPVMLGGVLYKHSGRATLDGEKWLCLDDQYNIKPNDCIVYSFGINNEWSFDDKVASLLGCKVFSFDPTMKVEDHKRSANVQFYRLGISDKTNLQSPNMKVDRYENILKKLGHQNTVIDYLKMDVEGAERGFLQDILHKTPHLLNNIKMIALEIHHGDASLPSKHLFWKYFHELECFGFKIIFSGKNMVKGNRVNYGGEVRSKCYEIVWAQERQW